jgi:16S rRNA (cytidine1402-2'-O)-methyltransferase
LIASGLPAEEFQFLGFLPEKAGARRTRLEKLATALSQAAPRELPRTLISYEAPHRILDTLADLEAVWGPELRVVVARELTKIHEEFVRGTVAEVRQELAGRDRIRGEITLLIEAPEQTADVASGTASAHEKLADRVARMIAESGPDARPGAKIDEKEALKRLARQLGRSKSELYRELQRERARKR